MMNKKQTRLGSFGKVHRRPESEQFFRMAKIPARRDSKPGRLCRQSLSLTILCILGLVLSQKMIRAAANDTSNGSWEEHFKRGSVHYQNKETEEARGAFKQALEALFPGTEAQAYKKDKALRALLDDEKTAAKTRYEIGLYHASQGDVETAAGLFHDALMIVSSQNARHLGYQDGCKSCHFKEWKSWKKTKMAQAFEVLKPGAAPEAKTKLGYDTQKDYTEDPSCLSCHTTGYGLPGGYQIPKNLKYKVRRVAEQSEGVTCEACHGPGSLYGPLHKDVEDKARMYRPDEFYAVGEYKVDEQVCARCHNRRNPTVGPDFHFDFHDQLDESTHEKLALKYRIPDEAK